MPQDSYELPSVYTSPSNKTYMGHEHQPYSDRNTSQQEIIQSPTSPTFRGQQPMTTVYQIPTAMRHDSYDDDYEDDSYHRTVHDDALGNQVHVYENQVDQDRWLAWLLLGASFSMLFFTLVPVVADIPEIVPGFFSGDTLWRLIDPLFTLPLNLFVMTRSTVVMTGGKSRYWGNLSEQSVVWLFWSVGAAIFVQGHGLHTASAMFKHPVQDFNLAHPEIVAQYPILQEIYSYMRDLWEHIIAHYMYALGGMIMSWAQLFAFRNQIHGPLTIGTKFVFAIGSLIYGLLLAGIAIEFPYGTYVGLVYSVVIGLICIMMITLNQNGLSRGGIITMGRRMVLQFYLGACIVGLVIVIIWVAIHGFKNRLDAGVAT